MLTCPYCQTENTNQVTQCVTCGSSLGSDVLPNGTLLFGNTLEVQSVLGRGGFGIVYKALHLEKQKYVAIKELFPEGLATRGYNKQVSTSSQSEMQNAIARTSREAQMLRKLKHPSATKLFAYWEENSTAYMALELLEGQTLESRIQNKQLLTAEETKQALLTILEVLEELHSHGFLHRDIKPANIMFTPTRVELIDFGSLTEFRKGERTKVSSRIATPEYAPLEQFGSEVTLSPATDLYALAATFCEAMTGSRVPSALDRANGASLEPSMIAVRRVSRELADILEKTLELRMEFRFSDTKRLKLSIESIKLHNNSIRFVPIYEPMNKKIKSPRKFLFALISSVAIILLIILNERRLSFYNKNPNDFLSLSIKNKTHYKKLELFSNISDSFAGILSFAITGEDSAVFNIGFNIKNKLYLNLLCFYSFVEKKCSKYNYFDYYGYSKLLFIDDKIVYSYENKVIVFNKIGKKLYEKSFKESQNLIFTYDKSLFIVTKPSQDFYFPVDNIYEFDTRTFKIINNKSFDKNLWIYNIIRSKNFLNFYFIEKSQFFEGICSVFSFNLDKFIIENKNELKNCGKIPKFNKYIEDIYENEDKFEPLKDLCKKSITDLNFPVKYIIKNNYVEILNKTCSTNYQRFSNTELALEYFGDIYIRQ